MNQQTRINTLTRAARQARVISLRALQNARGIKSGLI
jgi:hypothetical protein